MLEHDQATLDLTALVASFHRAVEAIRPGARYVLSMTDEMGLLSFCDGGGELRVTTRRAGATPRFTVDVHAELGVKMDRPRQVVLPQPITEHASIEAHQPSISDGQTFDATAHETNRALDA